MRRAMPCLSNMRLSEPRIYRIQRIGRISGMNSANKNYKQFIGSQQLASATKSD